jgi:hypothetical protein
MLERLNFELMLLYLSAFKDQDAMVFDPNPHGIMVPIPLTEHEGLKMAEQKTLTARDGVEFVIETIRPRRLDSPTFLVFHGNTGHWASASPEPLEHYNPSYRIGLLQEIVAAGAGLIAVSMRGYGLSQAEGVKPSQKGFDRDLNALADHLLEQGAVCRQLIILGESLGCYCAMKMSELLSEGDYPPPVVGLIAPFSSLREKALDIMVRELGLNSKKIKEKTLHRRINANLKHSFDLEELVTHLVKERTFLYIHHPEEDEVTLPVHGQRLARIALVNEIAHKLDLAPEVHHTNWDARYIVAKLMHKYQEMVEHVNPHNIPEVYEKKN